MPEIPVKKKQERLAANERSHEAHTPQPSTSPEQKQVIWEEHDVTDANGERMCRVRLCFEASETTTIGGKEDPRLLGKEARRLVDFMLQNDAGTEVDVFEVLKVQRKNGNTIFPILVSAKRLYRGNQYDPDGDAVLMSEQMDDPAAIGTFFHEVGHAFQERDAHFQKLTRWYGRSISLEGYPENPSSELKTVLAVMPELAVYIVKKDDARHERNRRLDEKIALLAEEHPAYIAKVQDLESQKKSVIGRLQFWKRDELKEAYEAAKIARDEHAEKIATLYDQKRHKMPDLVLQDVVRLVMERDANAFALKMIRKLKTLGIDLMRPFVHERYIGHEHGEQYEPPRVTNVMKELNRNLTFHKRSYTGKDIRIYKSEEDPFGIIPRIRSRS